MLSTTAPHKISRSEADTEPRIGELVRSRENLLLNGWTERRITAAVKNGALFHLRRGWYIESAERERLWPEQQHLAHVLAVARDSRGGAAMSHTSAAVLHGLPLHRMTCVRVQMTTDAPHRISSAPDVARHVAPLPAADVAVVDGVRCTTLARTVFDLIRTLPLEAAVSVADAAERRMAERLREWDLQSVAAWRREIAARLAGAGGARGIRKARWVAEFADGRAQLPGESVSRLQLVRLGFAAPDLQVPVEGPTGGHYFVDFGLDDVNAWGEFDGKQKYLDEALRSGRSMEQVMLEEKQREDWIRGRTQRRFARWGFEHIVTASALRDRLSSFGIRAP
ncbi:hypothetical protein [Microbacterium esteraromaticum]|uniref:hypothetical protein n=1 Tax=Microbacterium esteraromaticum TaxID=57043 RepID=UPI000B34E497|nr:hypothetical protein [Microbacterium esteraromaticum]